MLRYSVIFSFLVLLASSASIDTPQGAPVQPLDDSTVQIQYTLWFGTDIEREYSISLEVAAGSSFFQAMQVAADKDPTFVFSSTYFENLGNFIDEIGGVASDTVNNYFWLIYILPDSPNSASPPTNAALSPVGVDNIVVEDGKNYLFWYQYVVWEVEESAKLN